MTFGPEFREACISTFSTPLQALALLITSSVSGASISSTYEFTTSTYVTSASTWSTTKINSTTMLSTGLAIADPIVVAFQIEDFKSFPSEYATSLAKKIGVVLSTDSVRLDTPSQPGTDVPGLSTGAKAGIGVGVAVGALAFIIGIVLFCLRKRRKAKNQDPQQEHTIAEMADQDHDLAKKKWWSHGKWWSEASAQGEKQELDSKTVHVVPGPPQELGGEELQHPNDAGHAVLRTQHNVTSET